MAKDFSVLETVLGELGVLLGALKNRDAQLDMHEEDIAKAEEALAAKQVEGGKILASYEEAEQLLEAKLAEFIKEAAGMEMLPIDAADVAPIDAADVADVAVVGED